jgi:hypothetical protein
MAHKRKRDATEQRHESAKLIYQNKHRAYWSLDIENFENGSLMFQKQSVNLHTYYVYV